MDKSFLPIMRLNFGRILALPSSGRHILGRLECSGLQLISILNQLPTSCQDLWRTGHTISGFYSVQRSEEIETVFCDMTQVPGERKVLASDFFSTEQFVSI